MTPYKSTAVCVRKAIQTIQLKCGAQQTQILGIVVQLQQVQLGQVVQLLLLCHSAILPQIWLHEF